ncbi:MAG: phosphopantothenate--cysteine ligase [Clostridiales bacterium]|jgi:phosphopantothenate-cysteine ligase|nr:phosphopantothenate--cysteine ligase [Clostridiales bacterium]
MNVLVTSGGTTEKIDSVRSITNTSSGRLGAAIADAFGDIGGVSEVFYICGKTAALPMTHKAKITRVGGVVELEDVIRKTIAANDISAVAHCMAVSDYTVKTVTTARRAAEFVTAGAEKNAGGVHSAIEQAFDGACALEHRGKIGSNEETLLLVLKPTNKIIALFKELAPLAKLVGFKLLDAPTEDELLDAARRLLVENNCDYVLANDAKNMSRTRHIGYLIDRTARLARYDSKEGIALGIAERIAADLGIE